MTGGGRRRGFALLAVLWGAALLALLAVTLGTNARTDARLARNAAQKAREQAAVDGAVRLAIAELVSAPTRTPRGIARPLTVGEVSVAVTIQEAGGLVDLNSAPPPLLAALFVTAGAPPERAVRLAAAVLDWRDPDSDPVPLGAEADAYASAGLPPPANRRFEHLAELRRVIGVDADLYGRALAYATLQSRRAGLDPRVAPPELLFAIPGINRAAVQRFVRQRPVPLNAPVPALGPPPDLFTVSLADVFEIEAHTDSASRRATVRLTGRSADPVWLHAWDDGP